MMCGFWSMRAMSASGSESHRDLGVDAESLHFHPASMSIIFAG